MLNLDCENMVAIIPAKHQPFSRFQITKFKVRMQVPPFRTVLYYRKAFDLRNAGKVNQETCGSSLTSLFCFVLFNTHPLSFFLPFYPLPSSSHPIAFPLFFPFSIPCFLLSSIYFLRLLLLIFPSFLFLCSCYLFYLLTATFSCLPILSTNSSHFYTFYFLEFSSGLGEASSPLPSSPVWNVRVRGAALQQSFLSFPGHSLPKDKSTSGFPFFSSTLFCNPSFRLSGNFTPLLTWSLRKRNCWTDESFDLKRVMRVKLMFTVKSCNGTLCGSQLI